MENFATVREGIEAGGRWGKNFREGEDESDRGIHSDRLLGCFVFLLRPQQDICKARACRPFCLQLARVRVSD